MYKKLVGHSSQTIDHCHRWLQTLVYSQKFLSSRSIDRLFLLYLGPSQLYFSLSAIISCIYLIWLQESSLPTLEFTISKTFPSETVCIAKGSKRRHWWTNKIIFVVLLTWAIRRLDPGVEIWLDAKKKNKFHGQEEKFDSKIFQIYGDFCKSRPRHIFLFLNLHQIQTIGPTLTHRHTQNAKILQRILWYSAALAVL